LRLQINVVFPIGLFELLFVYSFKKMLNAFIETV